MKVDIATVPFEEQEILSAKLITGKLTRRETRDVITKFIEEIREDNNIIRVYLYEDEKQKEHGNNFVTAQWTHHNVEEIPNLHEDELIGENIFLRWNETHDETKKILEW